MTTPSNTAHFSWRELGVAYEAFSALCDPSDWQDILKSIAQSIALTEKSHVRILDIGAGLGNTSSAIRRFLYGTHGVTSAWHLIDPDPTAQVTQHMFMVPAGERLAVEYSPAMPVAGEYDVILFVHSTYYLSDLRATFEQCTRLLRRDGGIFIAVAMDTLSPFYFQSLGNLSSGVAEEVEEAMSSLGLTCDSCGIRSRFRYSSDLASDPLLLRLITQFVVGRLNCQQSDIEAVRTRLAGHETDFRDRLTVGRMKRC